MADDAEPITNAIVDNIIESNAATGPQAKDEHQRRMEILSRLQGKYAGLSGGSEQFATQKAEEKAREERQALRSPKGAAHPNRPGL